jgi:DNA-binding Lrp family transcriptional regulator
MNGLPKLDRIDLGILVHLQKNGQMTNLALSEAVNLSPSPCLARVKRLEKAGYITGYGARVDIAKLVNHIVVFTEITLEDNRRRDFVTFERTMRECEELQECHLVTGGYDYILKFITRNVFHYQELMESLLAKDIGIAKYFSYIAIKTIFVREEVAIKKLLDYGS